LRWVGLLPFFFFFVFHHLETTQIISTCVILHRKGGSVNTNAWGSLDVIELFSFESQTWKLTSFKLPFPLVSFKVELCDGILYLFGGAVIDGQDIIGIDDIWVLEHWQLLRHDPTIKLTWSLHPTKLPHKLYSHASVVV
jgi:hypothetical protein